MVAEIKRWVEGQGFDSHTSTKRARLRVGFGGGGGGLVPLKGNAMRMTEFFGIMGAYCNTSCLFVTTSAWPRDIQKCQLSKLHMSACSRHGSMRPKDLQIKLVYTELGTLAKIIMLAVS